MKRLIAMLRRLLHYVDKTGPRGPLHGVLVGCPTSRYR
jgi:hypothetical protein